MRRTQLGNFTREFDSSLRPLVDPMQAVADCLSSVAEDHPLHGLLPGLLDVQHQVENLANKVGRQQAYVLIFGPLKSGKSTLMNALSSAYVSEVSSLPGYPCLVRVSHAPERQLTITRYTGEEETFSDLAAMRIYVQRSHAVLAERIRSAESAGDTFDPAVHFPEAIQRIDVKMPAEALEQSGSVLVDTPGLYSRMRFDYDRMTREYRDVASCAIFVVKSDNLFLEQVFDEFDDLLNVFSKIFLVVNVDTTKMDLAAEGGLTPSLEQQDPTRVIEAFETLAMSAAMKRAADEGRLRTYPIDLLKAASERVATGHSPAGAPSESDPERDKHQSNFDAFLGDLTEFLNGSAHLVSFLEDNLRRARVLVSQTNRLCSAPEVDALLTRLAGLEGDQSEATRKLEALGRLCAFQWEGAFDNLRDKLASLARGRVTQLKENEEPHLRQLLDAWYASDESLSTLVEEDLLPLFSQSRQDLSAFLFRSLLEEVSRPSAAAQVSQSLMEDLLISEVNLEDLATAAAHRVEGKLRVPKIPVPLTPADFKVKKGFFDWFLFRSRNKVRARLFGAGESPGARVDETQKAKRLPGPVRASVLDTVARQHAAFVSDTSKDVRTKIVDKYVNLVCRDLRTRLETTRDEVNDKLDGLGREIQSASDVRAHLESLSTTANEVGVEVTDLARRYVPEPVHVLHPSTPVEPAASVPHAAESEPSPAEKPTG